MAWADYKPSESCLAAQSTFPNKGHEDGEGTHNLELGKLPEDHPDYSLVLSKAKLEGQEAIYRHVDSVTTEKRFGNLRYKIDPDLIGEGGIFDTEAEFLGLLSNVLSRENQRGVDLSKLVGDKPLIFSLVDRYSHLGGDGTKNRLVVMHRALRSIKEKDPAIFQAYVEMLLGHELVLHEIEESENEDDRLLVDIRNLSMGLRSRGKEFKELFEVLIETGLYTDDLKVKLDSVLQRIRDEVGFLQNLIENWDSYFGPVFRFDYFLDDEQAAQMERLIRGTVERFRHLARPFDEGGLVVTLSKKVIRDEGGKHLQHVGLEGSNWSSGSRAREEFAGEEVITKEALAEYAGSEGLDNVLIGSLEEGLGFLRERRPPDGLDKDAFLQVERGDYRLGSADFQEIPRAFGDRLAEFVENIKRHAPPRIRAIVDSIPIVLSVTDAGNARYPRLEYVEAFGIKIHLNRKDPFSVTDKAVTINIAQQIVEIFIGLVIAQQEDESGFDVELLSYISYLKSKDIVSEGFLDYMVLYMMQEPASGQPEEEREVPAGKPAFLDRVPLLGLECGERKVGRHRFILPSCFADPGPKEDFSARLVEKATIPVTGENRKVLDAIDAFNRFENINYEIIVLMRERPFRRSHIDEILRKLKEAIELWASIESLSTDGLASLEMPDFRSRLDYLEKRLQERFPAGDDTAIEDKRLIAEFITEIGKGKAGRTVKTGEIETLNEFLNQMHMRITTQVFRLQESDTPGKLYDLSIARGGGAPEEQIPVCWATEYPSREIPPSLECLLDVINKYGFGIDRRSRIMATDHTIWMDFRLGAHRSRIFVRLVPPEKGGCVIVNWIERGPQDDRPGEEDEHTDRLRIIEHVLVQAGFSPPVEMARYSKDRGARTLHDILQRFIDGFATVSLRQALDLDEQLARLRDPRERANAIEVLRRNFCTSYYYDYRESFDVDRMKRPEGRGEGPVDVILAEYEEQAPGVIGEINGVLEPLGIQFPEDKPLTQDNINEFIYNPLFKAVNERRVFVEGGELVKNKEWEEVSVMDTFQQMVNDAQAQEEMIKTASIYNLLRDQGFMGNARTIGYLGVMEIKEINYALINGLDLKIYAFVSPKTGDALFGIGCMGSCLYKSSAEVNFAENILRASLILKLLQRSSYLYRKVGIEGDLEYIKLQINELLQRAQTPPIRPVIFQRAPCRYISGDGVVSGRVVFSGPPEDDEILIVNNITPEHKEWYREARAVVAISGSATSHGGIELRGSGKSCLVGGERIEGNVFVLATQKEQEERCEVNIMGRIIPGILIGRVEGGAPHYLLEGDIVSVNCIDNTIEVVSVKEQETTYPIIDKILNYLKEMDNRKNRKAEELMDELRSIYGGDLPYRKRIVLFTLRELIFADYLKGKEETRILIGEILAMMKERTQGPERLDLLAERLLMSYFTEVLNEFLSILNEIREITESEDELSAVNVLNAYLYRIVRARCLLGELKGIAGYLNIEILGADLFDSFVGKVRESIGVLGAEFKGAAREMAEKEIFDLDPLRTMRAGLQHAVIVFPELREDPGISELLRIGEELEREFESRGETIGRPLVLDLDEASMAARTLVNLKAVNTARLYKRLAQDAAQDILERAGVGDYKLETVGGKVLTTEFSKKLMEHRYTGGDGETCLWEEIVSIAKEAPSLERARGSIKALIANTEIPEELRRVVDDVYREIGKEHVIIRSSGPTEDVAGEPGVGRYYSAAYVDKERLYKAVLVVIASLWDIDNIRQLREESSPNIDNYLMAMMIQEQLDADVSGVVFTGNPTTGNLEHAFINAGYGNGIGTMEGYGGVSTDRFIMWKDPGKKGEDAEDPLIAKKTVGMFFDKATGLWEKREMLEDMWKDPSLTDSQKRVLLEVGLFLEELYGYPRDIEFLIDWENKRIVIVQMRRISQFDITTIVESSEYYSQAQKLGPQLPPAAGGIDTAV